jgi:putative membrane protein
MSSSHATIAARAAEAQIDGARRNEIGAPDRSRDASQKKVDKLRDTKPDDFAAQFDPMQFSAHRDAVSLFERYAKGGDNPKLKDWAGKTLSARQHHLEIAQALDKNRK